MGTAHAAACERDGHVDPSTKQTTRAVEGLVQLGYLTEVKGPPWFIVTDAGRQADAREPRIDVG